MIRQGLLLEVAFATRCPSRASTLNIATVLFLDDSYVNIRVIFHVVAYYSTRQAQSAPHSRQVRTRLKLRTPHPPASFGSSQLHVCIDGTCYTYCDAVHDERHLVTLSSSICHAPCAGFLAAPCSVAGAVHVPASCLCASLTV